MDIELNKWGKVERVSFKNLDGQEVFAYAKGDLVRVVAESGKDHASWGVEGEIAWIGVTGNPKAWPSSPQAQRVDRLGIKLDGRKDYLFVNARSIAKIDRRSTPDDHVLADSLIDAFATLSR